MSDDNSKRLTALLLLALGFAALPLYHLWWFDVVTHATVAGVLTQWVLSKTDRTGLAVGGVMVTLIIWEVFEFTFPSLFVIGYSDTLADLMVGSMTVIVVLLLNRRYSVDD